MAAYSMEFRRAAAAAYDECLSSDEAAALMGCSGSWLRRLVQRRDAHAEPASDAALAPRPPKAPTTTSSTTTTSRSSGRWSRRSRT